jgi:hypothetical protein
VFHLHPLYFPSHIPITFHLTCRVAVLTPQAGTAVFVVIYFPIAEYPAKPY